MTIASFILLWIVSGFVLGSFIGNIIAQNATPLDDDDNNK